MQFDPQFPSDPGPESSETGFTGFGLPPADNMVRAKRDLRALLAHGTRLDPEVVSFFGEELRARIFSDVELELLEISAFNAATEAVRESLRSSGEARASYLAGQLLKLTSDIFQRRLGEFPESCDPLQAPNRPVLERTRWDSARLGCFYDVLDGLVLDCIPVEGGDVLEMLESLDLDHTSLNLLRRYVVDLAHYLVRDSSPKVIQPEDSVLPGPSLMSSVLALLELSIAFERRVYGEPGEAATGF
ncbi:MAG: hypothetical protein KDD64_08350 [Bdellovibrionales bacterium]|nr:hypothetical protein [Bdellovibrionales bacterium]